MRVRFGRGKTEYGSGVSITLTGDEVARAIITYLVARDVTVFGPRTVRVNGELCKKGHVYVDPSGSVIAHGRHFSGDGNYD